MKIRKVQTFFKSRKAMEGALETKLSNIVDEISVKFFLTVTALS